MPLIANIGCAAVIAALALLLVKYKFVLPSGKSSVVAGDIDVLVITPVVLL